MDTAQDASKTTELVAHLVQAGLVAVAEPTAADDLLWQACDAASLAENRLHQHIDPRTLDAAAVRALQSTVRGEDQLLRPPTHAPGDEVCCWLLDGAVRVGTVAVQYRDWGRPLVYVASLYVFGDQRGRGFGARAMRAVFAASQAVGARLVQLDTATTWLHTVQFYMRLGLWVRNWKHSLALQWDPRLPRYQVEFAGETATFAIESGAAMVVLFTAQRQGEWLVWQESPEVEAREKRRDYHVVLDGKMTFALHLALANWPLVRSLQTWADRYKWCDCGMPEGLARFIRWQIGYDRSLGFVGAGPQIAGLMELPERDEAE